MHPPFRGLWQRLRAALGGARRSGAARRFETLGPDGIRWRWRRMPERVVAVGDVQGDLEALDAILRGSGLVDAVGDWCGGGQHLVLLGDLVGGGRDSRYVVEMVMRLERQARRAGGRVHALLGNHDLRPVWGDLSRFTACEQRLFELHRDGDAAPAAANAFRGDSRLARWLRSRNAMVLVGDTLFAHAGIGDWFEATDPGAVNATIRAWIAHWQGRAVAPPEATRWSVGEPGMPRQGELACGPLWTRSFRADGRRQSGAPPRKHLLAWLARRGIARLVLGHSPVDELCLVHPYYGPAVVLCDTRLGDRDLGRLRALALGPDGPEVLRCRAGDRDRDCRRRERRRLLMGRLRAKRGFAWLPLAVTRRR